MQDIDTNGEHSDTESKAVLVGSNVTGIQELQEVHQNVSMQSGQKTSETDNDPRTQVLQLAVYRQSYKVIDCYPLAAGCL